MQRDFDVTTLEHRGGKVDIWVRGTQINTLTDAFAFSFEIERNVVFEVVGDPLDLRFKALSENLSPINPIIEMLDIPSRGLEFRNDSTGEVFVLTGVVIEDFNIIVLDTFTPQPSVSLLDVGGVIPRQEENLRGTRDRREELHRASGKAGLFRG